MAGTRPAGIRQTPPGRRIPPFSPSRAPGLHPDREPWSNPGRDFFSGKAFEASSALCAPFVSPDGRDPTRPCRYDKSDKDRTNQCPYDPLAMT